MLKAEILVGLGINNNCPSDDDVWRHPSQGLFLPQLFQYLGSFGGQCLSAVNGNGVSDLCCHPLQQTPSLLNHHWSAITGQPSTMFRLPIGKFPFNVCGFSSSNTIKFAKASLSRAVNYFLKYFSSFQRKQISCR